MEDGWKAVTYHQKGVPFEEDEWAVYHLDDDFSETRDLAAEHPQKLRELVDTWWLEAGADEVLPLDDRAGAELFRQPARPGTPHGRDSYIYFPPLTHMPSDDAPSLGARDWVGTFEISTERPDPVGVLYARGAHNVGQCLFLKDGKLQFDYNALGVHSRAAFPYSLPPGDHVIEARFKKDGRTEADITLSVDGKELGTTHIPLIVRMLGSTGLDIGCDRLSTVVDDYEGPFEFTGTIRKVTFDILSKRDRTDIEVLAQTEMSRE